MVKRKKNCSVQKQENIYKHKITEGAKRKTISKVFGLGLLISQTVMKNIWVVRQIMMALTLKNVLWVGNFQSSFCLSLHKQNMANNETWLQSETIYKSLLFLISPGGSPLDLF